MTEVEFEAVVSVFAGIALADRQAEPTEAERAQVEADVRRALKPWRDWEA